MAKKVLQAFIFFVQILAFSLPALAENIYLSHTLEDYTEGADTATLNLILHVENTGVTDYNNLTLSYVSLTVFAVEEVTLNLANIGAGEALDIPISIVSLQPFDQYIFEQNILYWAGEYENAEESGIRTEFPAKSHYIGGAP